MNAPFQEELSPLSNDEINYIKHLLEKEKDKLEGERFMRVHTLTYGELSEEEKTVYNKIILNKSIQIKRLQLILDKLDFHKEMELE
ncbi:MAG: hypothetical protein ACPKPY_13400 [Nitrososphaeraceae archaeon]